MKEIKRISKRKKHTNQTFKQVMATSLTASVALGLYSNTIEAEAGEIYEQKWIKNIGGNSTEEALGVNRTKDGGYITAGTSYSSNLGMKDDGDGMIAKFDANGNRTWLKGFGGTSAEAFFDAVQISDGGYVAVGMGSSTDSSYQFAGVYDGIIVKFDANGNLKWSKGVGGDNFDYLTSVAPTADGGVIAVGLAYSTDISGYTNKGDLDIVAVKYDTNGNRKWIKNYGGSGADLANSIRPSIDGGFLITGNSNSTNAGFTNTGDGMLIKIDANGTQQWMKKVGGNGYDEISSSVQLPNGDILVAGYTDSTNLGFTGKGEFDGMMAKLDANGNQKWVKVVGGSGYDYLRTIRQTTDGGVLAVGYSDSVDAGFQNKGENDAVLYKLDGEGEVQWVKGAGGSGDDKFVSVAENGANGIVAIGQSNSRDMGFTNSGDFDLILVNYNVYIDNEPPAQPTISADKTTPTKDNVNLTVSFASDVVRKEVRVNGGEWKAYTAPVPITANGKLEARGFDDAGNPSTIATYTVSNIDKIAPTVPTLLADKTNNSVTITFPTDAVTKEYRINGGAWTPYSTPVNMSVSGKVEARGTDAVGNVSVIGSLNVVVLYAPTITNTSPTNFASFSKKLSLQGTVRDADLGEVLTVKYRLNGKVGDAGTIGQTLTSNGTDQSYAFDVNLDSLPEGVLNLYIWAEDSDGQKSAELTKTVQIDKTAPTVTITPSTTLPTSKDVSLAIKTSDANGGAVVVTQVVKGQKDLSYFANVKDGTNTPVPFLVTENDIYTVYIRDLAGNETIQTINVQNIDRTAPTTPTFIPSITIPTNKTVSVTINFPTDATSKEYRVDGGEWLTYTSAVAFDENGKVEARATDGAGNVSEISTFTVSNLDKVAPTTPTLVADKTTPTNGNVVVNATFPTDASKKEYRIDGGAWTVYSTAITLTKNGLVEVRATDDAGNVSVIGSLTVSNIDKIAPVNATLLADKTTPTNTDVKVAITYPSDASVKEYKIGANGTWTAYTNPVVVNANNTVFARSTDAVGNVSTEASLVVSNIDKVAPTTPTLVADKTTPTNGNVNVTATFPSDSAKKEYRVDGGVWSAYTSAIVITKNGVVETRATDNAGNESALGTLTVSNIDKTAPVNPTFVASTTAPTNKDVAMTINFPSDATVKQYKLGSAGTWTTYTAPVVVSANTTLYARGYDVVGNVSNEVTFDVSNIDKVAPTIPTLVADKATATNGNVNVTVTFPADSAKKEYRVNGGDWTVYTSSISLTANGTVEARATDNAGNISSVGSLTVSNIDKTPPADATFQADKNTSTNTDVKVSITYPADASVKQYKIGENGTWTSYTTPVTVSSNNTVFARSTDAVGNVSNETEYAVTNIDKTPPTTPTLVADSTSPTNKDIKVTVSFPTDAKVKEYRVDGGTWTAYSTDIVLTKNGVVEARATDEAGNLSVVGTLNVSNIDKTAPVNATLSADKTTSTNTEVKVSIIYPSDASVKEYKIGANGTWTAYTTPVVVSANNTVYARSQDAVGNVSNESSLSVSNIDKTAPNQPTLTADKTTATNTNVLVTINFPSDAKIKEYRIDGGVWTIYSSAVSVSKNGVVEARATDEAGNVSTVGTLTVSNIDKTAPVDPSFVASTTAPTNKDVAMTINFPSDATVKQYKVGSTGTWTTYTAPVVVSANTTLYARGYDAVGNISNEVTFDVTNIDKVAPITPTLVADKTTATNGNVLVSVTFPADSSKKEYRVNGGDWTTYTTPVSLTANGTVEARATDNAGNISLVGSLSISNIDKTPPADATFQADKNSPTNTDVKVTITYPADASVKQYKVGENGTWTAYTTAVVVSENNTVYARSTDAVGNVSKETEYAVTNIDKVAPTTPTLVADKTTPTNTDVKVTVTFPTDAKVKEYRVDGGAWTTYSSVITISKNSIVETRTIDDAGNVSAIGSLSISNIDKTAPVNASLSADKTDATNTDVKVTISYPSDASVKEYKIGSSGTWIAYTTPVLVSSNNTVFARSTDAVGNISTEASLVVSNIDKTSPDQPTLKADKTTGTNTNVNVTIDFPTDANVKQYRVDGGTWTIYSSAVIITKNGLVEARAMDEAGNVSSIGSLSVSNIDKTAPVNPSFVPSTTTPTNKNVTVTINFPTDATVKQYKVGSTGTWTTYTTPVVVSANNTVYARGYDAVGNVSDESTFDVDNIDTIAPDVAKLVADKTTLINSDVKVTITFPSDASVKEYKVGKDGTWTAYTSPVVVSENGTVFARSTDAVGNVSVEASLIVSNIDKDAPSKPEIVADKTTPTNTDVKVTITYPSDASVKEYRLDGGAWTKYSSAITLTQNGKVEARAIDTAGNVSVLETLNVSNIDKSAPEDATLVADKTAPTNVDVNVTITYPTDAVKKEYKLDSGEWTAYTTPVVVKENTTVHARSTDAVGNISQVTLLAVKNIDKVAPVTPNFSVDSTDQTNGDVEVTITFPTDAVAKEYRIDSGAWTSYTAPITISQNGKVEARAKDNAGNYSEVGSYSVTNIDKTAPVKPTFTVNANTNTIEVKNVEDADSGVAKVLYAVDGGAWKEYSSIIILPDGQYELKVKVADKVGNESETTTVIVDLYKERLALAEASVKIAQGSLSQNDVESAQKLINKLPNSTEKTALLDSLTKVQAQIDAQLAEDKRQNQATLSVEKAEESDLRVDLDKAQEIVGKVEDPTKKAELQTRLDKQKEYVDLLDSVEGLVSESEKVKTQDTLDKARTQVGALENDEKSELNARLDVVEDYLEAIKALEKAKQTRNDADLKDALGKLELLDKNNPVLVDVLEEIKSGLADVEILSLVIVERYDLLKSRYDMSKVAYDSLVQSYYAIKYTGDFMYLRAGEKFALVSDTDKHFVLVQEQYTNLNEDYDEFVEERIQTQAEIQATSAVKVFEGTYTAYYETKAQDLINAVEDKVIRAELQKRFNDAKAKHESLQVEGTLQKATASVEKAESSKQDFYIREAYKLINVLTDEALKTALTERLVTLELQIELDKAVTSATQAVENAERYKSATFITNAQNKVTALPDGEVKNALQLRLDNLNAGNPVTDQSLLVTKAKNALSLAQSLKTKTYVDKAQTAIDLVEDATVKAELQAKLDAIVVK